MHDAADAIVPVKESVLPVIRLALLGQRFLGRANWIVARLGVNGVLAASHLENPPC
jgi:hypothetical protein